MPTSSFEYLFQMGYVFHTFVNTSCSRRQTNCITIFVQKIDLISREVEIVKSVLELSNITMNLMSSQKGMCLKLKIILFCLCCIHLPLWQHTPIWEWALSIGGGPARNKLKYKHWKFVCWLEKNPTTNWEVNRSWG